MFVKICGLRDSAHVDAAIEAGADAVGCVFHPKSVRNVTPAEAVTATANVPQRVKRVAVMRHPSNDDWQAVLGEFAPDVLQTDAEDFRALDVPQHVECWPVYREGNRVTGTDKPGLNASVTSFSDTWLFEGPKSGQGETVDWEAAANRATDGRMILAGGLHPGNVAEAIRIVRPYGVDVSSGVESGPGQKDPELISAFINAAKAAGNKL